MNRYSSERQYWRELIMASAFLVIMTVYLVFKTPVINVPSSIVTQWDSIWLANMPRPCSTISPLGGCWPREVSGCVKIERDFLGGWSVEKWALAQNQISIPMGSTGTCDSSFNATWHTHPAGLRDNNSLVGIYDPNYDPKKQGPEYSFLLFPNLSGTDLDALMKEPSFVVASMITWQPGKMNAAIKWRGHLVYPVRVR